ncbi:hypothetical protein GXN76_13330 [Kroppenstedtia pulmonis]|uniref:ABC transporter permease subunit n=1 Tax=Kroppenstedtia pulmonis TaxID=1380685 RepID=A0A7D3Y1H9_9BACL|nr:hypothetical protein [Kroppenstedtia pulmonis]QKG85360.1 hypothetical protein GXN76_13330 [Kroppenstedtia pulmonis]
MSKTGLRSFVVQDIKNALFQKRSIVILLLLGFVSFSVLDTLARHSVELSAEYNLADFLLVHFNDFNRVMYVISPLFLFLIGVLTLSQQDELRFLRCHSRWEWFSSKVIAMVLMAGIFLVTILLIASLVGIRPFSLQNEWSEATVLLSQDPKLSLAYGNVFRPELLSRLSPFQSVWISVFLLWGHLSFLGLVSLVINVGCKSRIWGTVGTLGFIFINATIYRMEIPSLDTYTLYANAMLSAHDFGYDASLPTLFQSSVYWILLVAVVVLIGYRFFRRMDINFGEKR